MNFVNHKTYKNSNARNANERYLRLQLLQTKQHE